MNDNFVLGEIDEYCDSLIVTGAKLGGFSFDSGTLYPAVIDPSVTNYKLVLPQGPINVTITPQKSARYTYQLINGVVHSGGYKRKLCTGCRFVPSRIYNKIIRG